MGDGDVRRRDRFQVETPEVVEFTSSRHRLDDDEEEIEVENPTTFIACHVNMWADLGKINLIGSARGNSMLMLNMYRWVVTGQKDLAKWGGIGKR